MSEAAINTSDLFASSVTDWYRARPFKVAFALSVIVHAAVLALVPGFRSVPVELPRVLEVELMSTSPIPRIEEKPVVVPKMVEPIEPDMPAVHPELKPEPVLRQPEPVPEPVLRQPRPEPIAEPVLKQPQPEPPPIARAEVIRAPRAEPKPEFVLPKTEPRPEAKAEPRLEFRPEPKIEPRPEPPPLARIEPRLEPQPLPRVEPRPEPKPEPRAEIRPEPRTEFKAQPQPVPRDVPPPSVQPRIDPVIAAPAAAQPAPPVATAPQPAAAPPVASVPALPSAPPQAVTGIDQAQENRLKETYGLSISKEIKRFQKYPPPAQRRGWEGTAEVLLQISAEGKVISITLGKSSGRDILDKEALDMVRRASPLPQAPPDLRGRALVVSVPIVFKLQNS